MKPREKAYHSDRAEKTVNPWQEKHDEELGEIEVENRGVVHGVGASEQKRAINWPAFGP